MCNVPIKVLEISGRIMENVGETFSKKGAFKGNGSSLVMLAKLLLWVCLLSLNQDIY